MRIFPANHLCNDFGRSAHANSCIEAKNSVFLQKGLCLCEESWIKTTCGLRHGALLAKICMQPNTPCSLRNLTKTSLSNLLLQLNILARELNMQSCLGEVAHPKPIVFGKSATRQEDIGLGQGSATLGLSSTNCACMHESPCNGRTSASRPKLKKDLYKCQSGRLQEKFPDDYEKLQLQFPKFPELYKITATDLDFLELILYEL